MEIHAKATYNKETIKRFALVPAKQLKIMNIILAVIFAVAFAAEIYGVILLEASISNIIFLALIVAFYYSYLYLIMPMLVYKQSKRISDSENSYIFTDKKFSVESSGEGINGRSEVEYTSLYKAVETKGFFYLYISKGQAMIVDKSTVTDGEAELIRQTIMLVLGKKYKVFK